MSIDTATLPPRSPARILQRPVWHLALGAVALVYTLVQLIFTLRVGLGWDETVYVSQVATGVPAAEFSAPRARGVPLLVAPIAIFTSSPEAIRGYLSVLSGAGLYLAYLPWLKLRNGPLVPVAAGLFAGLWTSLFYGNEAMPNLWVALAAVAGTGLFFLAVRTPVAGFGVLGAYALAALVRPTDALWAAAPLVVAAVSVRRWRRPATLGGVLGGLAIGWGAWLIEAVMHFGGPLARLSAAGTDNETGLHFSLPQHLRALDGPLLCRYTSPCGGYPLPHIAWFAAVPLLAALGLWATRHAPLALAAACGLAVAAGYVFTVGYAAPRFLMPAYALLSLPVAAGAGWLWTQVRPVGAVLMVAAAGAFLLLQAITLQHQLTASATSRAADPVVADALRSAGLTSPCLVYGHHAVEVGYLTHCSSKGVFSKYGGNKPPKSISVAQRQGAWIGVITNHKKLPARYLATWTTTPIAVPGGTHWYLYRPPART
ncbi:hypothetical protein J5X84_28145 [Streptosporangiaceae bacterium NEAU-GS5]|nr:hypothetical protein [Streptosporangiaceae bacterium NEAU-GS5]